MRKLIQPNACQCAEKITDIYLSQEDLRVPSNENVGENVTTYLAAVHIWKVYI